MQKMKKVFKPKTVLELLEFYLEDLNGNIRYLENLINNQNIRVL